MWRHTDEQDQIALEKAAQAFVRDFCLWMARNYWVSFRLALGDGREP